MDKNRKKLQRERKLCIVLMIVFAVLLAVGVAVAIVQNPFEGPAPGAEWFFAFLGGWAACLFFAVRAGKLRAELGKVPQPRKLDPVERRMRRRATLRVVLGMALSFAALLIGIDVQRDAGESWTEPLVMLALLVLFAALSPTLALFRKRRVARRRYEEGDGFLLGDPSKAAETADRRLTVLRDLRIMTRYAAALLLLAALGGSFWLGTLELGPMLLLWWPFAFFAGADVSAGIPARAA